MLSVERHLAMQSYPYKKVQPPPITLQKTGHQRQNRNSRGTPLSRVQYLDDSKSQMIVGVLASNPDRTSESESGPNYITQDQIKQKIDKKQKKSSKKYLHLAVTSLN